MRDNDNTSDLLRPEFEFQIAIGYYVAAGVTMFFGGFNFESWSVSLVIGCGLIAMGTKWLLVALPRIKQKRKLILNYLYKRDVKEIRKEVAKNPNQVFIGKGFEWGKEHGELYHRISSMSSDLDGLKLPKLFEIQSRKAIETTKRLGGKTWLHGLGKEKPIYQLPDNFAGHTFICGLPGTGKTSLLNLLSTTTLNRGSFNLIIDPKGDANWEKRMRSECKTLGVPFHFFSTSHPSKSCLIDPLRDFERSTDIASRICDVADSGNNSGTDPYIQFTWKCINQVVQALHYCGKSPQLKSISYYLRFAKEELATMALETFYVELFGGEEHFLAKRHTMRVDGGKPGDLAGMIDYYSNTEKVDPDNRHIAVDGIISFVTHDRAHMSKMLSSTEPLFDQLTSKPLDKLLSPNIDEVIAKNDGSYILNLEEMLASGGCLYISLNSLADNKIAGAIGKLILSALCSAAARRYAHAEGKGREVSVFVDESHSALNENLVTLLAVGRGASFSVYLSTQTIPDLEAKSDAATANRILGLCSNMFALRVSDSITQTWVSENFGTADMDSVSYMRNNRTGASDDMVDEHAAGFAETMSKTERPLFPPSALGNMPNLQYVARMQSGVKIKGRIPLLTE
ncbi:conjugative transfer system coupling protein TraD [Photobacterium sp. ZSDE20]|uniref:Conjugative transfer system coupling protein TraD n=1 Tax=Photobacterium pectinilyticum TaxID=2906793 RepID=A0ABT1N589_9GAMM|nr:conjugative transfer system coupling protein TraD [Photobacterium sp. ZSDE20]MCQ1058404.1 conjugative transfer system coupling protein TraD [Photobacterium sp. ZSDE20]MDD1825233.1 conjugative transfer system coupling protein TraD [Photobacterium sp. ZSDE20]